MRASFLGCPIDILTMAETVNLARQAMRSRQRLQHVALNVAKFVSMRSDPMLAADVANSDIVGIDGMGIVWGARALGLPVTSRVTGVDLLSELLEVCAREGFRPYFLGATATVLQQAVQRVRDKHPSLVFAGLKHGYFTSEQECDVISDIQSAGADCLFIGMPTPRKERFLAAHRDELGVPFIMGVGGAFDVLAGAVLRAPVQMQQFGLEWVYRIYQEPRRMWWRYARTNTLFAGVLAQALVQQALRGHPTAYGTLPPGAGRIGG
ncbi:WecB/TagA/CpsF family glycosyltransferase [Bradyrhizobium canariense]|uniref:WecB/TagA/CpsF family glycosyltransferase n=1 Tax=Bradyrhizobium canariense TaxID=255045 RepID=UPI001C676CAA|nr:WecB/TagA/CpsF family glycosyltransferase [Bradyrhizobium canariense]MBW5438041.1 WecB/TagA/CpsF family glycosyltransferase [Bradyrhizobium canariense]